MQFRLVKVDFDFNILLNVIFSVNFYAQQNICIDTIINANESS